MTERKVSTLNRILAGVVALAMLVPALVFLMMTVSSGLAGAWPEMASQLVGFIGAMALLSAARETAAKGVWSRGFRNRAFAGGVGVVIASAAWGPVSAVVGDAKQRSMTSAHMRSHLRFMASAESTYHAMNGRFTTDLAELPRFEPGRDIVIEILHADSATLNARALYRYSTRTCEITLSIHSGTAAVENPTCVQRGRYRKNFPAEVLQAGQER